VDPGKQVLEGHVPAWAMRLSDGAVADDVGIVNMVPRREVIDQPRALIRGRFTN
jgi:hypothetical protein